MTRNTTLAMRIVQEAIMALIVKIEEYDEKESWIEYTKCLEQYFAANEITGSGKKRAVLLSVCKAKMYKLIRNLVNPRKPAKTVFAMECLNSTPVSVTDIRTGTRRDPILSQVMKYVQQGWPNYNSDEALKPYFSRKDELSVQDGCLLWGNLVIPPKERASVVEELHETHPGILSNESISKKLRVVA